MRGCNTFNNCFVDTVDLQPILFDVGDGIFATLTPKKFNLVVKVQSASDTKLGMFQSQLYLSDDASLMSGTVEQVRPSC